MADLVGGHVKINVYCPECKECRVFSGEGIPYYWYDDHDHEILARPLEEEIVSWQKAQAMDGIHPANNSEKPWTWTNKSTEDDTRLMVFKFFCAMDNAHHLDYIVLTNGNKMKK